MAKLPQPANTEDNNSTSGFDLIEEGDHIVTLKKSELRDAKSNPDNKYIHCTWQVVEGPEKGKMCFDMLNIINSNPIAVNISTKRLNQIAQAAGIANLEDTDELLGIPILASIIIDESDNDYPDQNKITRFMPADGSGDDGDDW